jgi:hydroxypyruvate reductase
VNDLERLFRRTLAQLSGQVLVQRELQENPLNGPVDLLSIGKAAPSMALGAVQAKTARIERILVVAKEDPGGMPFSVLLGDHPVPGPQSLAAGAAVADFLRSARHPILALLSGGASALVELLRPATTLEELQKRTNEMLRGGLPIAEINGERRRSSQLKGGGMAEMAAAGAARVLVLSDVLGNDLSVIGSGPFWLGAERSPPHRILADSTTVVAQMRVAAEEEGIVVETLTPMATDVDQEADRIATAVFANPEALVIVGGEPTVTVVGHGLGGRAQHLSLLLARRLAESDHFFLAAGTDGTDGPTPAAGGWGKSGDYASNPAGYDAAIAAFDAYPFLEAQGRLVMTGPTGTNLNDIVLVSGARCRYTVEPNRT